MKYQHIHTVLCAAFLVTSIASCLPKGKGSSKREKAPTRTSIRKAIDSGDWDYVRHACDWKDRYSSHYYNNRVKPLACDKLSQRKALAPVESATCDTIRTVYRDFGKRNRGRTFLIAATNKLLECKHYTFVFENVPEEDGGMNMGTGEHVLRWVGWKKRKQTLAAWVAYLESHKGAAFFKLPEGHNARRAMAATGKWLVHGKFYKLCAPLTAALAGEGERKYMPFIKYIRNASCTDAKTDIAKLLTSKSPSVRERACKTLEVIGDSSVLPALKPLQTDFHKELRKGHWKFTVLEACAKARRAIEKRSK